MFVTPHIQVLLPKYFSVGLHMESFIRPCTAEGIIQGSGKGESKTYGECT